MQIKTNLGFSVVELLISMAISLLLLTTVLFNFSTSNDNLALSSASQEIAIYLRQAQVYALSVKESSVGSGSFNYAYGIHFDTASGQNDKYILFVDRLATANGLYDVGSGACGSLTTECLEQVPIRNGVKITGVCDDTVCPPVGATKINITFLRPNPDARVYFTNNAGTVVAGPSLQGRVTLTSPKGMTSTLKVEKIGQISVQ